MNYSILIVLLLLISGKVCAQVDKQLEKETLKKVDIAFSDLSKEKGIKEAFLTYAADDGVLLRPFTMPIVGIDEIKKFLDAGDANFTMTWTPLFADVSSSGEFGYTYGTYDLVFKDEAGTEQLRKGTYVSIWKKDDNGNWKFTLDTGNPGLEPKK